MDQVTQLPDTAISTGGVPFTFALSAPVAATTGDITEVTITKLPGVREFLQSGLPVDALGEYDMAAAARLLADCSAVPEFTFSKMSGADLLTLTMRFSRLLARGDATGPKLRAPNGADLIAAGMPMNSSGRFNVANIIRLGMALSGKDADAIQALPTLEFLAMTNEIAGFLGGRTSTSSASTSTSQTAGETSDTSSV